MNTYTRVIPRDFFNEAKLLKCLGQLSLAILDGKKPQGITVVIVESGEPFQIELSDDGYLCVANYETFINGQVATFKTTYNSKSPYPLYCDHYESGEEIEVFDDAGNFTKEFIAAFSQSDHVTPKRTTQREQPAKENTDV